MPVRRNRRQYEQLTDFDRGRIIGLREAGWSNRRIGRHLGQDDMVVARCWQQWITEGRVYRRGGTSSAIKRNHKETTDQSWLEEPTSAKDALPLTPHHRQCRLDFADLRQRWGSNFLGHTIIFSGPSRHFDSSQMSGRYFNADCATHTIKSPGAIYQQDNARPHTARLSQQCLQGYDVLPWPARSPDLSPIEHV
ncbi:transposable element Tc1 transposase [Trichonephila clavipes]|nr:transposable element Tc1 transposase [Trichonephila clavipes]